MSTTYEVNARLVVFGRMEDFSVEYTTISGAQNAETVLKSLEDKEKTMWSTEEIQLIDTLSGHPNESVTDVEFLNITQVDRTVL